MVASDGIQPDLPRVFARLRPVLEPYMGAMEAMQDNSRGLYLNARTLMKNRQPQFFAAVMLTSEHVGFYVQAVELYPDLLDSFGLLEERLEGLSCLTFQTVSDAEVEAMAALLRAGQARMKAKGDL